MLTSRTPLINDGNGTNVTETQRKSPRRLAIIGGLGVALVVVAVVAISSVSSVSTGLMTAMNGSTSVISSSDVASDYYDPFVGENCPVFQDYYEECNADEEKECGAPTADDVGLLCDEFLTDEDCAEEISEHDFVEWIYGFYCHRNTSLLPNITTAPELPDVDAQYNPLINLNFTSDEPFVGENCPVFQAYYEGCVGSNHSCYTPSSQAAYVMCEEWETNEECAEEIEEHPVVLELYEFYCIDDEEEDGAGDEDVQMSTASDSGAGE